MEPTERNTKHKPEKTNVGEEILDLVISYIHDVEDRNSVSLVSRKLCEIVGTTLKRVTVHTLYSNPSRLSKRFPFIQSLTLKGPPSFYNQTHFNDIRITPWIEQLALEFICLKELRIRHLVVHDEDLETLAKTRGKDLRCLKISKCKGFSTDGLRHVSRYCNQLRSLSLENSCDIDAKGGIWLRELALNSTVLERLHATSTHSNAEDLTLIAKSCCNSLISLKIGKCNLSKLGDAFRYALRLEHFNGDNLDEESGLVGFQFPQRMCSISIKNLPVTRCSIVFPFLNQIRKLKLMYLPKDKKCQCLLLKRCPNLEVLYTDDVCVGGLQVIGQFCKKLRKLTHYGLVRHVGLIDLAKGCTNLECLEVRHGHISYVAIKSIGTHLKNLRKFRMHMVKKYKTTNQELDNGFLAMLMGCLKLERLDISISHGGLTDVGLEYIGKYGGNLRFLSLTRIGDSNAGLVKLSKGCPNLRKLKLIACPFSEQAVTNYVFDMPSLRYVWFDTGRRDHLVLALTRPEFHL